MQTAEFLFQLLVRRQAHEVRASPAATAEN
jgi:hypothetical protein